jgi:hypothetical protein
MGTSQASPAPNTQSWKKLAGTLRSPIRNASTIVDATFSVASEIIPSGYTGTPLSSSVHEGLKFANSVTTDGINKTAKENSLSVNSKCVAPSISHSLWKIASSKMEQNYVNSPFHKIAEVAFKQTLNSVMLKGVKAMEENQ